MPLLVLDTGGVFLKNFEDAQNGPLVEPIASTMVEALGLIGYDALNLGPGDLLLPGALLRSLAGGARFPFLSANVVDAGGRPAFARWVVKERGGWRVGVLGLAGDQRLPVPPPAGGLTVLEPAAAAAAAVAQLRKECDLVVVLSQLGLDEDAKLARAVPGIDVILGGFSRQTTAVPRVEGGTLIVHAGAKGMRLGVLDLDVAAGAAGPWSARGARAASPARTFAWATVPLDAAIPDDPDVAALLERHRARQRQQQQADQALRPAAAPVGNPAYVGARACMSCHAAQFLQWSSSKHARALASLERKRQDLNPDCLRCHVTALGDPDGYRPGVPAREHLANVQCEACHGFGREHRGRDRRIRGPVPEGVCRRCHTTENSPTFSYEPYLRKLGAHAARHFTTRHAPPRSPLP